MVFTPFIVLDPYLCVIPFIESPILKGKNQIGYYAYTDESLYLVLNSSHPLPPIHKSYHPLP